MCPAGGSAQTCESSMQWPLPSAQQWLLDWHLSSTSPTRLWAPRQICLQGAHHTCCMPPRQRPWSPHTLMEPGSHGHPHLHGKGCPLQGDKQWQQGRPPRALGTVGGRLFPGVLSDQDGQAEERWAQPPASATWTRRVTLCWGSKRRCSARCHLRALALGCQGIKQLSYSQWPPVL